MQKKFIVIVLLAYSICIYSQSFRGLVKDGDGKGVPYATVALLEKSDSTFVDGCVTNDEGTFFFDSSPNDKLLKITCLGYESLIVHATDSICISLERVSTSLGEVTITGHRPVFKFDNNLLVCQIEGTIYSELGKGIDVLHQLPLMNCEGLSVLGRGTPLVFINNREMRNSAELDRITSDMIKDIKIDLTPGAKYGSETKAVILITTNRPLGEGVGGSIEISENVSSCWDTYGLLNLNYRRKNLDLFLSSSYDTFCNQHYKRKDTYEFIYQNQEAHAEYDGDGYNSSRSGYVSFGLNYQLTPKQVIGTTYTFSKLFSNTSEQSYHNQMILDNTVTDFESSTISHSHNNAHNMSVYYENSFSDKFTMNVDGTFYHHGNYNKQSVIYDIKEENSIFVPATRTASNLGALKATFASKIFKGELKYGFEGTYTSFRQKYQLEYTDNTGLLQEGNSKSVQAANRFFISYSRIYKNISAQIGIKYEYTDYYYFSNGIKQKESCKTYHHFLPSMSLSYKLKNTSFLIGYNIYTSRPSYNELDETLKYISTIRYYKGNSQLKNNYTHQISLMTSYKDLLFSFDYSYNTNAMITLFEVMKNTPAILATDKNISYPNIYAYVSYSPTFFRIWKPSWVFYIYKQWLTYDGINYNHPATGMQWKNIVNLPKKWMLVFNLYGSLKGDNNTYTALPSVTSNFYLQKTNKNCRIKAGMTNIFNSKEKGYSQFNGIYTSHKVNNYNPSFYITFSYFFNPAKSRYKGTGAGNDEKDRL